MAQSLAQILLHLVFSTQSRYKFLAEYDIRKEMLAYLTTVFRTYKSPSLEVGPPIISMPCVRFRRPSRSPN
ncbi:MAG: hypothetical protein LAO31_12165 [Acidobacteriia bacterium]|nr:hypothetical protein [Terriglobia bacterium]